MVGCELVVAGDGVSANGAASVVRTGYSIAHAGACMYRLFVVIVSSSWRRRIQFEIDFRKETI